MKSVYFIAEIGKACNGDLAYCRQLLEECKKAGVNAVRFHHFFLEESVYRDVLKKNTERAWSFKLQLPFLKEALFSEEDYASILRWTQLLDLDLVATPWDHKSLQLFAKLGVTHYKVNSINVMNIPLVKAILQLGHRAYLSTGGLSEGDIQKLCLKLNLSNHNVALLHAALAYPAPLNIINIRAIEIMKKYHPEVGYSSNDMTQVASLMACALGATVIDKHVHLENPRAELHKASIAIKQFAEEINNIQEMRELMTRKIKQESRGEMVNHELLSKSLVLNNDLCKGSALNEEDLTLQLPSKGMTGKEWFEVVGKEVVCDLKKGNYLYSANLKRPEVVTKSLKGFSSIPGKKGVVVCLKDIDEMVDGRDVDYVEVHYVASDLDKEDVCKEYDLDLVVHLPEYAEGRLLDLSSHDKSLRLLSIKVINKVMQKARKLKSHFKRCEGPLKFVVHPGTLTYLLPDINAKEQYALFHDSLSQMDASGLEILIENMTPFAWFLREDWSPKQGMSNSFLDAGDIAQFCEEYNLSMCLDVCHAKLWCNHANKDLYSYMKIVRPFVKHLHFSDCTGIDGEGLQVGKGEINWQEICEVFDDYEYGWTPEIWNGHMDHGEKFYEAHDQLNQEFIWYFENKKAILVKNLLEV